MEDNQVLDLDQDQNPPTDDTSEPGNATNTEDEGIDEGSGLKYKKVGDNRFEWEDGLVTDKEGTVIEDKKPDDEPPAAPEPSKPVVPAIKPVPQVQQQVQQPQKWTPETAYAYIYREEELQKVAEMSLSDPVSAERKRAEMNVNYQNALSWIRTQASGDFDQDMDNLLVNSPTVVRLFGPQIERARQRLRTDEMQRPGAAQRLVADIMAQGFTQSPDTMEEFAQRYMGNQTPAPQKKETPPRKVAVIPPEDRVPGPGTSRRVAPRPKAADREDELYKIYRYELYNNPSISDEEIREMVDNAKRMDAFRLRKAGV